MRKALPLLVAFIFFAFTGLQAATVSLAQAQTIALNFFKLTYASQVGRNTITATLKYTQTEPDSTADFYVFDISPLNGFVIVAAHDEVKPVLAYSNESNFLLNFQQCGLVNWVNKTAGQIHNTVLQHIQPDARINQLWSAYAQGTNPGSAKSSSLGPMLSTTWNQRPYYNQNCPVNPSDGQLCVTGCVATAMAQIMKYWNYPPQGAGSFSYVDDNVHGDQLNIGTLSANFGTTTYQWTQMPNYLTGNNAAVGRLMSDCGISVAMDYSDGGSGAWVLQSEANGYYGYSGAPCAQKAYATYFLYEPSTLQGVRQSNYTTTQWINLLESEMNAGRVVQYEGADPGAGGHTWVCDGYDVNNNLHMNWGWGGAANGFYAVTNLSAGGYNFYAQDAALIGIEPLGYTPTGAGTCISYHPNAAQDVLATINTVYPATPGTTTDIISQHWTWNSVPGEVRSLMKLDLSAIPANSYITSARISFFADDTSHLGYVGQPTYGSANASYLQQITAAWNNSVTWNTQPAVSTANQVTLAQSVNYTQNYPGVDITQFVRGWVQNPASNYGMELKMAGSNYYNSMIFYSSSNADTTKTPLLNICYYPCNALASFTFQSLGGSMLQFTNTSTSNMGLSSSWVFYNQSGAFATSTATNPQITFMGQPPYSASLFIQDSLLTSCFDSISMAITFNPNTTCIILQQGATRAVGADMEAFYPTQNYDFTTFPEFVCSHWTHGGNPTENRSLLKYDFSSIPAGSVVVSAFLSLYADSTAILDNLGQPTYGSQNASNLFRVATAWDPATVTWNTAPGLGAAPPVLLPQSTSTDQDYLNIDLTGFVQNWVASPGSNYGMELQMIAQNAYNTMIFCSPGKADSTKWPRLEVCFIAPHQCQARASFLQQTLGGGQVQFTNTSVDNIAFISQWTFYNNSGPISTTNVTNPTITFTGPPPYSATLIIIDTVCTDTSSQVVNLINCITFQQGATSATGGNIAAFYPTQNFDYTNFPQVISAHWTNGGTPTEDRGLLKYDLSQIPIGSVITSAKLSLFADTNSSYDIAGQPTYGTDNASYIHLVTAPWNPATVTWNTQPAVSNNNMVLLPQSTSVAEDYQDIDISAFTQQWVNNPTTNYGMLLEMITQNHYNTLIFCSPGYANAAKWPKLDICYQIASPCHMAASFTQRELGRSRIQYTNTSTYNNNTTINWTFYNGNGVFTTSTIANPLIAFSGPAPYSATCQITDTATGCVDTLQQASSVCTLASGFTYTVLPGNNVQFTNTTTGTGFDQYWLFFNGNGSFASSSLRNPLIAYTGPGPYSASLAVWDTTHLNYCTDTIVIKMNLPVGISEPADDASGLLIFPNPANSNSFNLRLPTGYDPATTEIKVLDMMGREIRVSVIERSSGYCRLSLAEESAAGIYSVIVSNSDRLRFGRLVVVK